MQPFPTLSMPCRIGPSKAEQILHSTDEILSIVHHYTLRDEEGSLTGVRENMTLNWHK